MKLVPKLLLSLLSIIDPGIGQAYKGKIGRAIIIIGLQLIITNCGILLTGKSFQLFISYLIIQLTFSIIVIIDFIKLKPNDDKKFSAKTAIIFFIITMLTINISQHFVEKHLDETLAYVVVDEKMIPNLKVGDRIMVDANYDEADLKYGSVIIYYDSAWDADFFSRIIGLPGDTIEINDYLINVNGTEESTTLTSKRMSTNYDYELDIYESSLKGFKYHYCVYKSESDGGEGRGELEQFVVPEGEYFLMADKRTGAVDSRDIGTIGINRIRGVAQYVYWGDELGKNLTVD